MTMRTGESTAGYGALDPRPSNKDSGEVWHEEKKEEGKHGHAFTHNDKNNNNSHQEVRFFPTQHKEEGITGGTDGRSRLWLAILACLLAVFIIITTGYCHRKKNGRIFEVQNYYFDSDLYDYIVVGGGPSGIIVAYKLAKELKNCKVLLLESGTASQSAVLKAMRRREGSNNNDNNNNNRGAPEDSDEFLNLFDIPLMWSGVASSQGRRMSMAGGDYSVLSSDSWSSHHWPIPLTLLGRGLGGSGLHNAMIYVRSLPTDFQQWNLTGWTWDDILPLYRELETFIDTTWGEALPDSWNPSDQPKQPWRGSSGPAVTVPSGPAVDAVAPLFVESAIASGVPRAAKGFNHPDPGARLGAGYYEFNIRNGVRGSVAEALLGDGNELPSNLVIRTGATVTRVLIRPPRRSAGVEYVDSETGEIHHVMLPGNDRDAEVILASGAIMTPQLLANSGIGEDGQVANLTGVGKNLQDHPAVAMSFSIAPELAESATSIYTVADEMEDYLVAVTELEKNRQRFGITNSSSLLSVSRITSRLGTLATSGFSAGAFLRSPWANPDNAAPDIQLTVFPRVIEPHVTRHERNQDKTALRSRAMLVTVALLQPDARYEVYPASNQASVTAFDSLEPKFSAGMPLAGTFQYPLPSIQLPANSTKYLSDRDVKRLSWGMEQVRRILSVPPIATKTGLELCPGTNIAGTLLEDYVRQHNLPNSHWVGTTKMGTKDDPTAVVDEQLRVLGGVEGLRIVDSGVFPHIPNGNTHSTVCVVASRAADLIARGRYKRLHKKPGDGV